MKYYCSICLIIRDESEYLKEWLDWHIGQGVQHFYIYDHGSKNSVEKFVKSLGADIADKITITDWSGSHENAQPDAYNDCLKRFGNESKWIGFIDTDEHVRVKTGQPLPEFLKNYEEFAGIFAVWVTYGANGQKEKSGLPLRQRFPQITPVRGFVDKMGKVFVQPNLMKDMYIHNGHPVDGFDVVGEKKDIVPEAQIFKEDPTTDLICVDHYFTKSYEEWIEKFKRGRCHARFQRRYEEFFVYNPDMEYCREDISPTQEYEVSKKIIQDQNEMKILLKLDELTGKVIFYKKNEDDFTDDQKIRQKIYESEFREFDVTIDMENLDFFLKAEQENQDVFYENGQLIKKPKDPDEYHNALKKLTEKLEALKIEERNAFIAFAESRKRPEAELKLKAAITTREEKMQMINAFKNCYSEEVKHKKMAECLNTVFKYECSICLIIRDENEYLEEWLNWHIGQGVQHFYIYDHGSKQPVAAFIKTLDADIQNKITVTYFGGTHYFAQHEAYNDCLERFGKESRWIGFIDSDEMVRVINGKKLPEVLKEYEDHAGLFMVWVVYDANGQKNKSLLPCRERFTKVNSKNVWPGMGKSFVQPAYIRRMFTHHGLPFTGFSIVDEDRDPVYDKSIIKDKIPMTQVCIDHYYTKSYEEWLDKISRGACDPYYQRKYDEFFTFNPDMEYCREDVFPVQEYEISKK